jgi:hypothetical protein
MATPTKPVFEPKTQAFVSALAAQDGKPLYQPRYLPRRSNQKIQKEEIA